MRPSGVLMAITRWESVLLRPPWLICNHGFELHRRVVAQGPGPGVYVPPFWGLILCLNALKRGFVDQLAAHKIFMNPHY